MPTKTERILSYLPRTFRAHPRPTALYALAEAFGGELLRAENALAEVMQAHWVDHADRGADAITDLRLMATLYGLAPRPSPMPEETVEEFRERLKRHVRTFLDGTATLRGVLRVTADALALRIDDQRLDAWWSRTGPDPVTVRPRGDDAAGLLFGVPHAFVRGHAARAARAEGPVLPPQGADLREGAILRLSFDGGAPVSVDCAAGAADASRVLLDVVVDAVNAALGPNVAEDVDGRLVLTSPTRGESSELVVHEVRGDAAPVLLGLPARVHWGKAATDAVIRGTADLPDPIDLSDRRYLRLAVDRARLAEIDCAGATPAATPLADVVAKINAALGPVASLDGARLVLASPTHGAAGALGVQEPGAQDAAPLLLGDAPRDAQGTDAAPAEAIGAVTLGPEVDLSAVFAVRVKQDARRAVTVDTAGADPAHTLPDEAAARLAAALAPGTARFDGRLHLLAGSAGDESRLEILPVVATEDAAPALLGIRPRTFRGAAAAPAQLRSPVDIPELERLPVQPEGPGGLPRTESGNAVEIGLRTPRRLQAVEGGADLQGARLYVDRGDGTFVAVPAHAAPADEDTWMLTPAGGSAPVPSLTATRLRIVGADAQAPHVVAVVVRRGMDVSARGRLLLAVDGGRPVEVDLRQGVEDPEHAKPAELMQAINRALQDAGGDWIATVDAGRVVLTSLTRGTAGSIDLRPLEETTPLKFLVRAHVISEAAPMLLGVPAARAQGTDAEPARLEGAKDLTRGVDLRAGRWLRIRVDGFAAVDVDCAASPYVPRPRAALPDEIANAIRAGLYRAHPELSAIVAVRRGRLVLTSRRKGAAALVALEPPRPEDARDALLGREPGLWRGHDGRRVIFAGTADLSRGVDLSAADRIRVRIEGTKKEIACAGADPANTALPEIVTAVNAAFGDLVARGDGAHLVLFAKSPDGVLEILPPSQGDATRIVLGIDPPRAYHGDPARPARLAGTISLPATLDLRLRRFLRVAVNGGDPVAVDCAAQAADAAKVTPEDAARALNDALAPTVHAAMVDGRLVLETEGMGSGARIELLPYESGDARAALLGDVAAEAAGRAPTAAEIVGTLDLRQTADLSAGKTLRLSIDGGRPIDVDVGGVVPERTELPEVLAALARALPGVAAADGDGRLHLASPSTGEASGVEILPVRSLDIVEYPAADRDEDARTLHHGESARFDNDGAADADARIELHAPHGSASPALVNAAMGTRVRLRAALDPGESVRFDRDPDLGVRAWIVPAEWKDGEREPRPVPPEDVAAGSAGDTARVPFAGERLLTRAHPDESAELRLEDPFQPRAVVLRARTEPADPASPKPAPRLYARVAEAAPPPRPTLAPGADGDRVRLAGRLASDGGRWMLVDGDGNPFARVLPGTAVPLRWHDGRMVAAEGELHEVLGEFPNLVARRVDRLYDVELRDAARGGEPARYPGVSIGSGEAEDSLVRRVVAAPAPIAVAAEEDRGAVLSLSRGRTAWTYIECHGPRFDFDDFAAPPHTRFPGGRACRERGIFDVSRFAAGDEAEGGAVFARPGDAAAAPVELRVSWTRHAPGAFDLLLPAVLPDFLGAAMDEGRLGGQGQAERYDGVVTEPAGDADHILAKMETSRLVIARQVARVPIGFTGIPIPFRRPRVRRLLNGRADRPARLYLTDPDVPLVIELTAKDVAASARAGEPVEAPGAWGNAIEIEVAPTPGGPGRFDVAVRFAGARTESARQAARGGTYAPATDAEIAAPGPVGVLQARAAGVAARVLRGRTEVPRSPESPDNP